MSHTVVEEQGTGTLHVWALPTDEQSLLSLVTTLFEKYWRHIWFGVIIQGAAWEVAAPNAPERIGMYDGYVTVDFGRWHFHLCIGEHTASGPELGRIRRCARAELYRSINADDGSPVSWGVRLFNGLDEQLMTVLLPNPFLTDRQQILHPPDFTRLAAWDELRATYLDLAPDPLDRAGKGFEHS
ncbi:hypothetical protein Ssi03_72570 [Sphaerisporangium siamense]|uniref:Uncharacterized protein n=1 Tax=Sphaerisporangium siamense TaxID=795645 RepID=A0A7W7G9V9_9ACTN|nr:hypothetical protein [Sphaerisporangium siamense]MBB4699356.1 hypothetical protein [Sphaerisporangium siamense]GII89267.1 hypothetical protein Ssi03_72570 [Sphaerisporangium siamense]